MKRFYLFLSMVLLGVATLAGCVPPDPNLWGKGTPKVSPMPSLPVAENFFLAEEDLPFIDKVLYESVPPPADYNQQYSRIRTLLQTEDGKRVLFAFSLDPNNYTMLFNVELLLVDSQYNVLKKEPLEDAFYSIGDSFSPGQGCYALGNTVYLVDGELTVQPLEIALESERVTPILKADGQLYVQCTAAPKRTLYKVVDSYGGVELIYTIENNQEEDFDWSPHDHPEEFRVVTSTEIYCFNSQGERRMILNLEAMKKDFPDFFGQGSINFLFENRKMNSIGFSFEKRIQVDSAYQYVYLSIDRFEEQKLQNPLAPPKTSTGYGCAELIRYKIQPNGEVVFDRDLCAYDGKSTSAEAISTYAKYIEDAYGNGYLQSACWELSDSIPYEYYRITEDGLEAEPCMRNVLWVSQSMGGEEMVRFNNQFSLLEAKELIQLGFLQPEQDGYMNMLFEEDMHFAIENGIAKGPAMQSLARLSLHPKAPETETDNRKPIVMYMQKDVNTPVADIVAGFEKANPEYRLDIQEFESMDALRNTLSTELLAGKGPDIIYCHPMPFINPEKTFQSGSLLDLTPYIDQNPDFDMESYYKLVMDAGVVEGKRYLAPLDFDYYTINTTGEVLAKAGLKAGDSLSVEKLLALCQGQSSPYVFTALTYELPGWEEYIPFYRYLANMGVPMADAGNEKALFDQDAFQKALPFLKTLYQEQGAVSWGEMKPLEQMKDDGAMLWNPTTQFSGYTLYYWEPPVVQAGKEAVLLAAPTVEKGSPGGTVRNGMCVNANAKEKDGAIKFVLYALSEEGQAKIVSAQMPSVPVRKQVLEAQIEYYKERMTADDEVISGVTEEYIAPYRKMLDDMGSCQLRDPELEKMVNEAVGKYMKDEITLEQMTKELMQRVGLYLKE